MSDRVTPSPFALSARNGHEHRMADRPDHLDANYRRVRRLIDLSS